MSSRTKRLLKRFYAALVVARYLRKSAWRVQDWFAGRLRSEPDWNVVLIVRVDQIGDFVIWLNSAERLKSYFSPKRVVLVANRTVSELAERCGCFDQVISVDVPRFGFDRRYRFCILRQVRELRASIAIQPTYSRVFTIGDALIRASGAPQRIGSAGDLTNISAAQRAISDQWYTRLIPASPGAMTEIERHSEFLLGLGLANVRPTVSYIRTVAALPQSIRANTDYFVVFPGASATKRMWSADNYGAVARTIVTRYRWQLVVCGSAAERALGRQVIERSKVSGADSLCGMTSLPELVEVIRGAKLLIGNETSAVHIAAAVGTPSVCLLGGGHFGRFVPYPPIFPGTKPTAVFEQMPCYGCNWNCLYTLPEGSAVPCIAVIHVQSVLGAVQQAVLEFEDGHSVVVD